MRTTHAFFIPILLFLVYHAFAYFISPRYDSASLQFFLVDNLKSITWSCVIFFLAITFDFLRRATHPTNYLHVNDDWFLWLVTVALVFQLILAAGQGVLFMNGAPRLIALLNGHETAILFFVIGTAAINGLAYAIGVDMRS